MLTEEEVMLDEDTLTLLEGVAWQLATSRRVISKVMDLYVMLLLFMLYRLNSIVKHKDSSLVTKVV
jgi:hypothetical protein